MSELPYIEVEEIILRKTYNPKYGDYRQCICGHQYHRHFDSYSNMDNVGCKYCPCHSFVEFIGSIDVVEKFVKDSSPTAAAELEESLLEIKSSWVSADVQRRMYETELLEKHWLLTQKMLNTLRN